MSDTSNTATNPPAPEFAIQRIYLKDLSYESPNAPEIFRSEWKPTVNFDLNTNVTKLADDIYEIVLKITAGVKIAEKTAFLIELQLAGIFTVKAFPKDQIDHLLGSYCPNLLFPYAREIVSDIVNRGSFPPFYLAPVNFDALFAQELERRKKEAEAVKN